MFSFITSLPYYLGNLELTISVEWADPQPLGCACFYPSSTLLGLEAGSAMSNFLCGSKGLNLDFHARTINSLLTETSPKPHRPSSETGSHEVHAGLELAI